MVERVVASMTTLVYPVATRIASFMMEIGVLVFVVAIVWFCWQVFVIEAYQGCDVHPKKPSWLWWVVGAVLERLDLVCHFDCAVSEAKR